MKIHNPKHKKHKFSTFDFSKKASKTTKKHKVSNIFNITSVDNLCLHGVFHKRNVDNVENFFLSGKIYSKYLVFSDILIIDPGRI